MRIRCHIFGCSEDDHSLCARCDSHIYDYDFIQRPCRFICLMNAISHVMIKKLSKRKLESYRQAEVVARELRHQLSNNYRDDKRLCDLVINWMKITGEIKYKRPS